MTTSPTTARALAAAITLAADRLDSEEHRYVERYIPCPNGCVFEGAANPVRVAGPADCDECFYGTAEDENAEHFSPVIDRLRGAAVTMTALAQLVDVLPTVAPDDLHAVLQSYKDPLTALVAVLRTPMAPLPGDTA